MGCTPHGTMASLAGAGPMGLGAADYALHGGNAPSLLVVTPASMADPVGALRALTGGDGFNDGFVYAPVKSVVEMGDALLARDGCLNFFAGPTDPAFSAGFNFYNVHYASTHIVGTGGGNTDDMLESIRLMEQKKINPAGMVTHIGGLNAVAETPLNLPKIRGAKKLIYTHVTLPLTAIEDFGRLAAECGENAQLFAELDRICSAAGGLWCPEAERLLLSKASAD